MGGCKKRLFTNYKREEGGGKENGRKLKRPVITMKIQSPMKIVFITVCCRFLLDSVETQSLKYLLPSKHYRKKRHNN